MPLGLGLMMGLGHNVAASGGGAAATTWNGVTSSSDWVLSNGNLTATRPAGSGDKMVLGSAFKTAGSFTVTITATGSGNRIIGVANASVSNATYVGDANSLGYIASNGDILFANSVLTNVATSGVGDVITVIANGDSTFTFKKNGSTLYTATTTLTSVTPAASANGTGTVFDLNASGF
jgi:hypothetical protein